MIGAGVLGIIATFLPWASVGPITISGTAGDGWLTLGLFVVGLIVVLAAGRKTGELGGGALIGASIPALLALALGALKIVQVGEVDGGMASPGIGLYVVVAAGALFPILGFALKGKAASAA